MKKLKLRKIARISLLVLLTGLLIFSAISMIGYLSRAQKVNEALVESYRPSLNVELIKKAAKILKR